MKNKFAGNLLILFASLFCVSLFAARDLRRHFEARELGEDCSVYGAVAERTNEEIAKLKEVLSEQEEYYRSEEAILSECAKGKGLPFERRSADLMLVSEGCRSEYDGLLTLEYSMENNERDLKELVQNLKMLNRVVVYYCGRKI